MAWLIQYDYIKIQCTKVLTYECDDVVVATKTRQKTAYKCRYCDIVSCKLHKIELHCIKTHTPNDFELKKLDFMGFRDIDCIMCKICGFKVHTVSSALLHSANHKRYQFTCGEARRQLFRHDQEITCTCKQCGFTTDDAGYCIIHDAHHKFVGEQRLELFNYLVVEGGIDEYTARYIVQRAYPINKKVV